MYHLRQLRCALALARLRHFGRAADAVGITQSGLTQSIARLEDYYGVRLFDRDRSGVTPTAFGEVLLEAAVAALERLDDAGRRIRLMDDLETGELSVGSDPMLSAEVLAPAFAELLAEHPRLHFRVRTGSYAELAPAIERGEVDLFVGFPHPAMGHRVEVTEFELPAPRVVMAPDHPLLDVEDPGPADYLAWPLVQGPIAHWYREWVDAQLAGQGLDLDPAAGYFLETEDSGMLVAVIRRSRALMAAMWEDVRLAVEAGELVERSPPNWPQKIPAVVVKSAARTPLPAAERLAGVILARAQSA